MGCMNQTHRHVMLFLKAWSLDDISRFVRIGWLIEGNSTTINFFRMSSKLVTRL